MSDRPSRLRRAYVEALLLFYPASFRQRWGAEVAACLDEILSGEARGPISTARLWLSAFADAAYQGTRERAAGLKRTRHSTAPSPHQGSERPLGRQNRTTMEDILRDTRHAIRALMKRPGFTTVSILTLAIGIGANSAIFSVVNGVLLKPLPVHEPDRLVSLWHAAPGIDADEINQSDASYFLYSENNRVFESVALWDNRNSTITGLGEPERVRSLFVTASFLPTLGIPMQLGRGFNEDDDRAGAPGTVVLTDEYWRTRLGSDPGAVGRSLTIDADPYQIIGVLGPELQSLMPAYMILTPARLDRASVNNGNMSFQAFARLRPGVTMDQAYADIERLLPRLATDFEGAITPTMLAEARFEPLIRPILEDVIRGVDTILWVLLGTVGIILLIACANVANLYLVRAQGRQTEIAVRTAMGASRRAILRFFLLESTILGLAGGVVGLVFAIGGLKGLLLVSPDRTPRIADIGIDPAVLAFTAAIALGAGVLFGLFPALRYGRPDLTAALKEGGLRSGAGVEGNRMRNTLVVAQMALALVLLVGSGLMLRSFEALRSVDPGFDTPEELLTVRIGLPASLVEEPAAVAALHEQIVRRLERVPGVSSAGVSSSVSMDGNDNHTPIVVEDFLVNEGSLPPLHRFKDIAGDYFQTMGIPLLGGRTVEWTDIANRAPVIVVNEMFARTYWDNPSEALGKRLSRGTDRTWGEIVGVVGNVRDDGMDQDPVAIVYYPMIWVRDGGLLTAERIMSHVVRTGQGTALTAQVREAIWSVNPNLPLTSLGSHAEVVEQSFERTSFTMVVLAISAVVALLLGTVGIYGVISYVVSQRTREIGVRMALGADQSTVSRLVVRQGMRLAIFGVIIGLVAAAGLTRVLSSLLFGVSPLDPLTFGAVTVILTSIAGLATWVPARRAAGLEPATVLRGE